MAKAKKPAGEAAADATAKEAPSQSDVARKLLEQKQAASARAAGGPPGKEHGRDSMKNLGLRAQKRPASINRRTQGK